MRVALFQPHVPILANTPSLGLLYLAAVLRNADFEVRVFDERIDREAFKKTACFKPDIFGVSAVTPAYPQGLRWSRQIKEILPKVKVVFGGPHPSALPLSTLAEDAVDYVIMGEAERTLLFLCERLRAGIVEGKREFYEERLLTDEELTELPWPAFETMDLHRYFKQLQVHGIYQRGKRILPIMTSRGCPNHCTFCCRVMGHGIRKRSQEDIILEIDRLIAHYQIDELYIEDDNFTHDKPRAMKILHAINWLGIKYLKFANGVNINTMDEELLRAMKEANIYSISFGIESGCAATLEKMRKNINLKRAREIIRVAKQMGFLVGANCIIGYPGETKEDVRTSLKYFKGLSLDSMAVTSLIPFPGTEARRVCERYGYLTSEAEDWSNYYFSLNKPIPLIGTPWISKRELIKEVKGAYRKMYFNLHWLLKALKNIGVKKLCLLVWLAFFKRGE